MMIIREAQEKDFTGIINLYAQLNPDDPELADGRDWETFKQILSLDLLILFVVLVDDQIVATCYLNIIPNLTRNASAYGIIENVVTDRKLRGRGYGKAVVKYALQYAWQRGCYKVMLQTGSKRESTHRFYTSCGFSANEKFAFVARPT